MTPAEAWVEFDAAAEAITDARNADLMLAWQINRLWALTWNGKLPPLWEVLTGKVVNRHGRQTIAQMRAAASVIAAQSQGLVRVHG